MNRYDIVFTGELASGFTKEEVISNLVSLMKILESQAKALVSCKELKLKKDISGVEGMRYFRALTKQGLVVDLVLSPMKNRRLETKKPAPEITLESKDPSATSVTINPLLQRVTSSHSKGLDPIKTDFVESKKGELVNNTIETTPRNIPSITSQNSDSDSDKGKIIQKPRGNAIISRWLSSRFGTDQIDLVEMEQSDSISNNNQESTSLKTSNAKQEENNRYDLLDLLNRLLVIFVLSLIFLLVKDLLPEKAIKLLFIPPIIWSIFRIIKFRLQKIGLYGLIFGLLASILTITNLWLYTLTVYTVFLLLLTIIFMIPDRNERNQSIKAYKRVIKQKRLSNDQLIV